MPSFKGMDLSSEVFITSRDGVKVPIKIEEINLNPFKFPEVVGRIIGSPHKSKNNICQIKKVIFNDPATIVIWSDDSKTVVKCQPGDTYSKELGLAMCISKKFLGNKGNFNEEFKKWIPEEISVEEMREKLQKFCEEAECSTECLLNKYRCNFDRLSPDEVRQEYKIIFENKEV